MIAKTCVAPFDRVKILFQTYSTVYTSRRLVPTLLQIYHNEGIRGWFRGNVSHVVRVFPYAAIQFASFDRYKQLLRNASVPGANFLAGSCAGATAVCCTYPLDLIRARLAIRADDAVGIREVVRSLAAEGGGIGKFFSGLSPTLVGIVPYAGINFFVYEGLKGAYLRRHNKAENDSIPTMFRLAFGASAGLAAQTVTHPLDVIRRRMQVMNVAQHLGVSYTGTWNALSTIWLKEGMRGLFLGLSLNYAKVVPQVAIAFTVFDSLKKTFGLQGSLKSE